MKRFLLVAVLLSVFAFAMPTAAQAEVNIREIPVVGLPAYDLRLAPAGDAAALYLGERARVLLGVPLIGYEVDAAAAAIVLIDLQTGAERMRFNGQTDFAADVAFSPDGSLLAGYFQNGEILVWEVSTGEVVHEIVAIPGYYQMRFLPDNQTLVTLQPLAPAVFLHWDIATGHVTRVWRRALASYGQLQLGDTFGRLDYGVTAWNISPDGSQVVTANGNGQVLLFDAERFQSRQLRAVDADPARFPVRHLRFTASGREIVYYDDAADAVQFIESASGQPTASVPVTGTSYALSASESLLAWATRDEEIQVISASEPDQVTTVPIAVPEGLRFDFNAPLVFTPGDALVVGGFFSTEGASDSVLVVVELGG